MIKYFLLLFLLIFSDISFSEEIYLKCSISGSFSDSIDGRREIKEHESFVNITKVNDYLFIESQNTYDGTTINVTTNLEKFKKLNLVVTNLTDSDNFDLSNSVNFDNRTANYQIKINRINGSIYIYLDSNFKSYSKVVELSGSCNKTSKTRKF